MNEYNKITALYSRLSVGDEDRDGGESNSIVNQKAFLERYAQQQRLTNIRHYIDDDESGRFFDRSAYSRMMEDVENGKIGVCIMKDLTRWGRDYLQVGNAMEVFRRNNVRFIAVNNGIDSDNPDTLEFAPFINIMSEWYAKDISKKVKTGIRTKGASGKPIATEAPYGYMKDPNNKDFWIIDEEAAEVVRLIFRLFIGGKNRNQIAVYLKNEQILTPTFYLKQHDRGTAKSRPLNEENRYKWNKATLTKILTRQEYCGDVVNFKTTKHFRDKRNHYVDKSEWQITENVHEPIIDRADFETVQRILENAPVRRPNGDGEIHPLSGLMFCKDCGAKMHIRIDYRNGGKRHVAFCSEYHKGKAKNPKCNSPHIIDADLVMQTIADVLKKVAEYSISNREEFEALVRKNLDMQQTDKSKKQQKRIPQITTRLEQIDKVLNKLYEDTALVSTYSVTAIAAYGVTGKLETILFYPAMALNMVLTTIIGQCAGGARYDRAKDYLKCALGYGCGLLVILSVLVVGFSKQLSGLFVRSSDVAVIVGTYFLIVSIGYVLNTVTNCYLGALNGMGKPSISMFLMIFYYIVVRMPLAYLLSYLGFGLNGIWVAVLVSHIVASLAATMTGTVLIRKKGNIKA